MIETGKKMQYPKNATISSILLHTRFYPGKKGVEMAFDRFI